MNRDRDFERWVRERLSGWPVAQVVAFERWLLEEEHFEFVPAVREALRRRSEESSKRGLIDDLVLRLKGLVRVRALLEDRGASVVEIAEHTAEIERLRAQLAEAVRATAA